MLIDGFIAAVIIKFNLVADFLLDFDKNLIKFIEELFI